MNEKTKAILFDFDGTIADSERILIDSLNALASEFGFKPLAFEELSILREKSAKALVTERLHIPLWKFFTIARLEKRGKEEFIKRARSAEVFTGIKEAIVQIREKYAVGIVTTNAAESVTLILEKTGITVDFIQSGSRAFGKARALKQALKKYSLRAEEVLYIGDELRDVEACKKVGIKMIGVAWGLNSPEALRSAGIEVVSTPEELLSVVANTHTEE